MADRFARWTDNEIRRVLRAGVAHDTRRELELELARREVRGQRISREREQPVRALIEVAGR